jgi:hypothetical protein
MWAGWILALFFRIAAECIPSYYRLALGFAAGFALISAALWILRFGPYLKPGAKLRPIQAKEQPVPSVQITGKTKMQGV